MNHHQPETRLIRRTYVASLPLALLLFGGCDPSDERAVLDTDELGRAGQPAPGQEPETHDSPLNAPDTYLRTEFELETDKDFETDVWIEEITAGLRVEVKLEDAEPGTYEVVIHESGACGSQPLGPPLNLTARADDDAKREIGRIDVESDGEARARWLTSRGNLREKQDHTVLGRAFALYRAGEKNPLACGKVIMD